MRLGKVQFVREYVVDLDNEEMVEEARSWVLGDLESAMTHEDFIANIKEIEDDTLTVDDIQLEMYTGLYYEKEK